MRHIKLIFALLLVLTTLLNISALGHSPSFKDEDEIKAALENIGESVSPLARLKRLTAGRAGWPTEAQAAEEFKIMRASESFAPDRDLAHAERGADVERIRRVLAPLFALHGGGSTLIISVLYTTQPKIGINRGSVLLITSGLLRLLNDDELLALSAHEVGHQYFRREFLRALDAGDNRALRIIELKCDAIAVLSLLILNHKPDALVRGLQWAKGSVYDLSSGDSSAHPDLKLRKRLISLLAT